MADDKAIYQLTVFELYEYPEPPKQNGDWKAAALRGPALPALGHALAGATGAAVSNLMTYPLSLIVARMQMQRIAAKKKRAAGGDDKDGQEGEKYSSILDAARKIYAKEGIAGFYIGVGQDTGKTIADSFLFFLAYTFLRQRRLNSRARAGGKRRAVLPVLDELAIGIIAGAFAKLWTTPLANIVTRKQTAAVVGDSRSSSASTRAIAAQIRAEKGITGFWSGYSASLILTLNPSITLCLNELLKCLLLPRRQRQKPSAAVTFLLAAVSKAIASTITYPFSLAKTRAQANGVGSNSRDDTATQDNGRDGERPSILPTVFSTLRAIALEEGVGALYDGLLGEVLKGFFSHGITMLTKDAVHSAIVQFYYALLVILRRYPTPEELLQRAHEQAEEYADVAREGAKDLEGTVAVKVPSSVAVIVTSNAPSSYAPEDTNELAEMVAEYVEDEAEEWRSLYRWFWERFK
ncbi:hypothetical protein VTN77DRAFT_6986 [Rasamsonia byssochlamydoides]|uniref:uncharacterized protein n=1 Tax=Rasamsonia byssochlamydoides TaxID=89139 RepID=UPI00374215A9